MGNDFQDQNNASKLVQEPDDHELIAKEAKPRTGGNAGDPLGPGWKLFNRFLLILLLLFACYIALSFLMFPGG